MNSTLTPRAWVALLNPIQANAFALSYLEPRSRRVSIKIPAGPVRTGQLVHTFTVESSITHCHHFYGVRIQAEEGKECPKGKLEVRLDHTTVLKGKLSYFAKDRDPLLIRWKETKKDFFWAVELLHDNQADGKQRLGYMLPNQSHLEVWVEVEPQKGPVTLEIEVLMNLYNAGTKGAPKLKEIKA